MITIFAKREPTTDTVAIRHGLGHKKDVVFYKDSACTEPMARKPWHQSGLPRRNSKSVILNCYRWSLSWVA